MVSTLAIPKVEYYLVSVAEQLGLRLTWSENPEDRFSHDKSQFRRETTNTDVTQAVLYFCTFQYSYHANCGA